MSDANHPNIQSLRQRAAAVRESLEREGFDVSSHEVNNGNWGRIDLDVSHPDAARQPGKVQIHCSAKGNLSSVPQGLLASRIAKVLGVATNAPGGAAASRVTLAASSRAARGTGPKAPEGTLVVDCSKTGHSLIGPTEWRGVIRRDGAWVECFRSPLFERGHNNVGEFLAIVEALRRVDERAIDATALYSDSRTALAWVRKGEPKSKFDPETAFDASFASALREAVRWVTGGGARRSRITPELWPTSQWGDIPADFGRK